MLEGIKFSAWMFFAFWAGMGWQIGISWALYIPATVVGFVAVYMITTIGD